MGGWWRINKVPYRVWVKQSIHTESLFPKYLNYYYILTCFFNYSSFTLPNVLWARFCSDEITYERFLFRENFAMDVLRVGWNWSKRNEVRINRRYVLFYLWWGLTEVCIKVKISSNPITHRGIQGHFLSEFVFCWDVDPYHVLTLVSLFDYLPSIPR